MDPPSRRNLQPLIRSNNMDSKFQSLIYILIFIFVSLTAVMVILEATKPDCLGLVDEKGNCLVNGTEALVAESPNVLDG